MGMTVAEEDPAILVVAVDMIVGEGDLVVDLLVGLTVDHLVDLVMINISMTNHHIHLMKIL